VLTVPGYRLTKPSRPVRIHSSRPAGGGFAPFTPAGLKQAVENFYRYQVGQQSAYPRPKAAYVPAADIGIGHEPGQEMAKAILNRTDLPSCGEPTKLWVTGPDLWAELDRVPEPIARMCESGQFSEVSAEIYPDYITPDGKRIGPLLRRISLLGAAQPRQKGLGRLPPFVYSFAEPASPTKTRPARNQTVCISFSEGPFTMTREQALAVLAAAGIDTSALASLDASADPVIIAFATYVQGQAPGTGQPPAAPTMNFAEVVSRAVAAAVTPVMGQMREMQKTFGGIMAENVRQECLTFAESEKDRLFPFERDEKTDKWIVTRLSRLPDDARKAEMEVIRARPKMKFSEQMGTADSGDTAARGARDNGPPSAERKAALMGMFPTGQAILAKKK
jgi:hypothetical protein